MNYLMNCLKIFHRLKIRLLVSLILCLPFLIYCLNAFIKSFLVFRCKESIIKLNDKIYILLF